MSRKAESDSDFLSLICNHKGYFPTQMEESDHLSLQRNPDLAKEERLKCGSLKVKQWKHLFSISEYSTGLKGDGVSFIGKSVHHAIQNDSLPLKRDQTELQW